MTLDLEQCFTATQDIASAWSALAPPNQMTVSQGAASTLKIQRPGGAGGMWNPAETPYMVEPIDMLASRLHTAVCFVGPAQTGKTVGLGEGWMSHAVMNDPGDMLVVQMTQDKAREYSKQRIDRAINNSPKLKAMRSALARDDNLHDKQFKNGMWLRIAWPTGTNLSSTSYRYVFGTDYDRWPDDIDGEGDGFTLMGKRVTTFLSRGMTAVESSPGRPITDPRWQPASPHEGPPVGGICGIYNRGDRRRRYWQCVHCAEWLQATPGLGLFRLPSDDELLDGIRDLDIDAFARDHARIACPTCGVFLRPVDRPRMEAGGVWLADGLSIDSQGRVSGTARTSSIASFWLGGVSAAYVTWEALIRKHCQALLEYAMTGSELQLQTTSNTDQGQPYMSRLLAAARDAERATTHERDLQRFMVPDDARFLVAAVDVQGGRNARFEVQVHAVHPWQEQTLVDRYSITTSKREGMGDEFAPLDPASYPEDWDVLTDRVLQSTYRLTDGRELRVHFTIVDSGGEDGVTNNAYAWYRRLRRRSDGLVRHVALAKGASTKVEWHIRESMVGGVQGQGDVPLQLLDPNKFKDLVYHGLQRTAPGPGYYHWPEPKSDANPKGWLPQSFFDELRAEVRNEKGVWEQIRKRNEAFDLCYMIRAACMLLRADKKTFWASPPPWALPLSSGNTGIMTGDERRAMKDTGGAPQSSLPRRSAHRSSYMS